MTSCKRRVVEKDSKQTILNFPQDSLYDDFMFDKSKNAKQSVHSTRQMKQQNCAKQTTYRSLSRANLLLNDSKYIVDENTQKTKKQTNTCKQSTSGFQSKPQSAITSKTMADSEDDQNEITRSSARKRDQKFGTKSTSSAKGVVVTKKPAQTKLIEHEYFSKLVSKQSKFVVKNFKLRNKTTGECFNFDIFDESSIIGLKNSSVIKSFDTTKLEVEYDYDTDSEQLIHSKKMLLNELFQAIDFYIREDPLVLVENVKLN